MLRKFLFNICLIGMILAASFPAAASTGKMDGMVLARVQYRTQEELNWLGARLDIWEVQAGAGYALAYVSAAEIETLQGEIQEVAYDEKEEAAVEETATPETVTEDNPAE